MIEYLLEVSNRFIDSHTKFDSYYVSPQRLAVVPLIAQCVRKGVPSPTMIAKYANMTMDAKLVITEPTTVLALTEDYLSYPGIYSIDQTRAWRKITEAVHKKGKKIFLQLWHCGLTNRPSSLDKNLTIMPKATVAGEVRLSEEKVPLPIPNPHTFKTNVIPKIVKQFRNGAQNALAAEFDGVEIHTAFGGLNDWFLKDISNQPTENLAEDLENRTELIVAVLENVASIWDEERVGIKISPSKQFLGSLDPDPEGTFYHVLNILNYYNLAYLHFVDTNKENLLINESYSSFPRLFHNACRNPMMLNIEKNLEASISTTGSKPDLISRCVWF